MLVINKRETFSLSIKSYQMQIYFMVYKLGYQTVRILFYDDIRFVIYSTVGAVSIGSITAFIILRRKRKEEI